VSAKGGFHLLDNAAISAMRAQFLAAQPQADDLLTSGALACEVMIHFFGYDWFRTNVGSAQGRPDPYLTVDDRDIESQYVHQHRGIELGRLLFEVQAVPNFLAVAERLKSQPAEDVVLELRVARLLSRSGHEVSFHPPSPVPGRKSYDLDVGFNESHLAVEVKAKLDEIDFSRSSLHGTLKKARQQLPHRGPGVIVIKIPQAWTADTSFTSEAEPLMEELLRNSSRLNAIVLVWDEWLPASPSGRAVVTRFRTFVNQRPYADVPAIDSLIPALVPKAAAPTALPFLT
jgi:hypothetical protein